MTASRAGDHERTPPNGNAWREAQKAVSDRNVAARKAGREERAAHEKRLRAFTRAAERKHEVFH